MDTAICISGIVDESIVDGPGIRLVVFTQGCPHLCEGCHNPETHSFDKGEFITTEDIIQRVNRNPLLDGITFSGGEPFAQAKALAYLGKKLKSLNLDIMTYTGYTYEMLMKGQSKVNGWEELLDITDILVDGKFEIEQKDISLAFRGSKNQRIIDLNETRKYNNIVLI